jgi:hypothetical protein
MNWKAILVALIVFAGVRPHPHEALSIQKRFGCGSTTNSYTE